MARGSRRVQPWSAILALVLACKCRCAAGSARKRPNFVIVLLDDAGWGDVGANWATTKETTNLDRLAQESLRLTDFHAGASVCTPSRAALLTGRLGQRTGVWKNLYQASLHGLPTTEIAFPEMLRAAGYRTAMAGKWHLGHAPPHHPSFRGFERYLGIPYSIDMGCTDTPGHDLPPLARCSDASRGAHPRLPAVPLYNSTGPGCSGKASCDGDIVEQPVELTSLAQRYGDFAEGFIKEHFTEPFLLYMALAHMHVPLAHDPRWEGASPRADRQVFGDTLAEADDLIGRVVRALDVAGVANDTLLIVTSDNGPWDMKCELSGLKGPFNGSYAVQHYNAGSGKFTVWEGGHRVPGLFRWPGTITPGVSGALASMLDLMPTLLSLAGVKMPSDRRFDGKDLGPVLRRETDEHHTTLFHPDRQGHFSAMRVGKYKAHFNITLAPRCLRDSRDTREQDDILADFNYTAPLPPEAHGQPLIFDLQADPGESSPLRAPPEGLVKRIHALLDRKMRDIHTDLRSEVDWSKGEAPGAWPCCSAAAGDCRCDASGVSPTHVGPGSAADAAVFLGEGGGAARPSEAA